MTHATRRQIRPTDAFAATTRSPNHPAVMALSARQIAAQQYQHGVTNDAAGDLRPAAEFYREGFIMSVECDDLPGALKCLAGMSSVAEKNPDAFGEYETALDRMRSLHTTDPARWSVARARIFAERARVRILHVHDRSKKDRPIKVDRLREALGDRISNLHEYRNALRATPRHAISDRKKLKWAINGSERYVVRIAMTGARFLVKQGEPRDAITIVNTAINLVDEPRRKESLALAACDIFAERYPASAAAFARDAQRCALQQWHESSRQNSDPYVRSVAHENLAKRLDLAAGVNPFRVARPQNSLSR